MKGSTLPKPSLHTWRDGKCDGLSKEAQRTEKAGLEEKTGQEETAKEALDFGVLSFLLRAGDADRSLRAVMLIEPGRIVRYFCSFFSRI